MSQNFNSQRAFQQAAVHHQAGQLQQAERIYKEILEAEPTNADALHLLGVLACQSGQPEMGADLIAQAVQVNPTQPAFYGNLGNALNQQGKLDEAIAAYRRAIKLKPNFADAHYNLGNTLRDQSRLDEAVTAYHQAIEINPHYLDAYYNLGIALHVQGRLDEAIAAYRRAIEIDPNFAKAYGNLGALLLEQNKLDEAITSCQHALSINPNYIEVHRNLRKALSRQISVWHFPMLADASRNEAYLRAIRKAVDGSSRVLDIGTGSSLLALMAARAGAGEVIASEMSKPLAEAAQQVIIDNNFSKTIRVVNKKSTALKVGVDIGERANVLLCEIFDVGLIGEGMVPILRHALKHLVTPEAKVIPQSASVYAILVEMPQLRVVNPISSVCGFDLSAFDRFRSPDDYRQLRLKYEPHRLLTKPVHVKKFDFRNLPRPASESNAHRIALEEPAIADGVVHAVAFWFDLYLDDDIRISAGPNELTHWSQAVQFFDRDMRVKEGEEIRFTMCHSDTRIWFNSPTVREE